MNGAVPGSHQAANNRCMSYSTQFLVSAVIPLLILGALIAWAITASVNEWCLKKRVSLPSACLRCKHGVDQSMLEGGRCPECGVAYVFAGIDTPRQRFETHVRTSSVTGVIVLGSAIVALVVGAISDRILPHSWPVALGIGVLIVGIVVPLWLVLTRRNRLKRQIDAMEVEASRNLDDLRAARARA